MTTVPGANHPSSVAVVAIAKNEGKFIAEWIAFHLAIGCDRIVVYVNDSTDQTEAILEKLSSHFPVQAIAWPSAKHRSPQRMAYMDAISTIKDCEWAAFIDIDEFIVPWRDQNIHEYLAKAKPDTAAIGINWRIFGSSGQVDAGYESVLHTFRRCSQPTFDFNNHIKTIARITAVDEMFIHHATLKHGQAVNSAFDPLVLPTTGRMKLAIYDGIQVNHYQCKTLNEFLERRAKGNANFNPRHTSHARSASVEGFNFVDRNDKQDRRLDALLPAFDAKFAEVKSVLKS